jgi:chemotaxis protein CheD
MELLVNAMLARGARRETMEAKLFGGARLIKGLTDVGALNADFSEDFVRREGMKLAGGSLRGESGRRIQFWPVSGRARQVFLAKDTAEQLSRPRTPPQPAAPSGGLELF